MRLSTKSRYGTRLVLDLAVNGRSGPVPIHDIAARQKISVKYLERIVQVLRKAGYIRSRRGNKGGHVLAKPLEMITVGEVVRVLEGDQVLVDCAGLADSCANSPSCVTRRVWMEAAQAMFEKLDAITFADLAGSVEQGAAFDFHCTNPARANGNGHS